MGLIDKKYVITLLLITCSYTSNCQNLDDISTCSKGKLERDLKTFVFFCKNKFNPLNYFQADSPCINCIAKDLKKFKFVKADKFGENYFISFIKKYSKRDINFLIINLFLNKLNKNSGSISFYPSFPGKNLSMSCILSVLGNPVGHNSDSTSIFWVTDLQNFFEFRMKEQELTFYSKDYEDFDILLGDRIPVADEIIYDSLPKLPVVKDFIIGLRTNDYFYENNIFSDDKKRVFEINFFKFCIRDFDDLLDKFRLKQREENEFDLALDSLENECFKNQKLYRGSSIDIYNYRSQDKPTNQIAINIACFRRPNDDDESIKKERIKNTLRYLIENLKNNSFLRNVEEIVNDFIDSIEIDKEKVSQIKKDNYLINNYYTKYWLTVFIDMPKAYFKSERNE